MVKKSFRAVKTILGTQDLMFADKMFVSFRKEQLLGPRLLTGWKKSPHAELNEWQKEESRQISEQRGSDLIFCV